MGKPSYDEETLAAYFHPVSPDLYDDPIVGPVLRRLEVEDPDIVLAVADVDRSLIRGALERTPEERLETAMNIWNGITRLKLAD